MTIKVLPQTYVTINDEAVQEYGTHFLYLYSKLNKRWKVLIVLIKNKCNKSRLPLALQHTPAVFSANIQTVSIWLNNKSVAVISTLEITASFVRKLII